MPKTPTGKRKPGPIARQASAAPKPVPPGKLPAAKTMELYNKLVAIITGWLDKLDASTLSTADGFTAFKLLAPSLESLAVLRAKIGEQRAAEARDVTAQMQTI